MAIEAGTRARNIPFALPALLAALLLGTLPGHADNDGTIDALRKAVSVRDHAPSETSSVRVAVTLARSGAHDPLPGTEARDDQRPRDVAECRLRSAACQSECKYQTHAAWCSGNRCEPELSQCLASIPSKVPGALPAACKAPDLEAATLLERHGEILVIDPDQLAQAYLMVVQARFACADGRLNEAFALYQQIVASLRETFQ